MERDNKPIPPPQLVVPKECPVCGATPVYMGQTLAIGVCWRQMVEFWCGAKLVRDSGKVDWRDIKGCSNAHDTALMYKKKYEEAAHVDPTTG